MSPLLWLMVSFKVPKEITPLRVGSGVTFADVRLCQDSGAEDAPTTKLLCVV